MMQGRRARQASDSSTAQSRCVTGYGSQGERACAAQLPSRSCRPETPIEFVIGALPLRALSWPRRPIAVSSNSSHSRPDQLAKFKNEG
jgi:hypothetical protein